MDHQVQRLMDPVIRALKSGADQEAVRRFSAAVCHETGLKHADLAVWLQDSIGKPLAQRLIRGFAKHPCMGCKRGLTVCPDCAGKGFFGDYRVCDPCVGLGAKSCDFCAGSGWITYNFVPDTLRVPVMLERTKLILAGARSLLSGDCPLADLSDRAGSRRILAGHLLQANRLLAALDNAVVIAMKPPGGENPTSTLLAKVGTACLKAAAKLDRRVRTVLLRLEELADLDAAQTTNAARRAVAERRASYYRTFAEKAVFTGTSLFHVHLAELGARRRTTRKVKRSSRPPGPPKTR